MLDSVSFKARYYVVYLKSVSRVVVFVEAEFVYNSHFPVLKFGSINVIKYRWIR